MQEIIDIVIVSYERIELTSYMVEMIKQHTDYPHRIIVIDNGSKGELVTHHLQQLKEVGSIDILVLLDKNYGLEPAKMVGLNFVRSKLYVDSDNDCLPAPRVSGVDWLTRLVSLMGNNSDIAALACPPQVFVGANREALFKDSGPIKEWDHVGGSLRLMRTDVVREVGGWRKSPTDMTEANRGEEWHICRKINDLGYGVGYARDIGCFHMFTNDGNWGYGETESYHRPQTPPKDEMFGTKEQFYESFNHGA